jgi:hypothetical protein
MGAWSPWSWGADAERRRPARGASCAARSGGGGASEPFPIDDARLNTSLWGEPGGDGVTERHPLPGSGSWRGLVEPLTGKQGSIRHIVTAPPLAHPGRAHGLAVDEDLGEPPKRRVGHYHGLADLAARVLALGLPLHDLDVEGTGAAVARRGGRRRRGVVQRVPGMSRQLHRCQSQPPCCESRSRRCPQTTAGANTQRGRGYP